jgi:hypothetical protein
VVLKTKIMKKNFEINVSGNICQVTAKTKKAEKWLKDNLYTESWQWNGNTVFIDGRFQDDIINAINQNF